MRVIQHYTGSKLRNFTYLIIGDQGHALIIDPWDGDESLALAQSHDALIKGIINTHEHWDHTRGNEVIVKKTDCPVYAHPRAEGKVKEANVFLSHNDFIQLDQGVILRAIDTPGHTMAHLCVMIEEKGKIVGIFTGDTLFNAGVGNCYNGGDPEILFETIESQFQTLDDDVRIYPGHEYLGNNLGFTLKYEPSNEVAKQWKKQYQGINWEEAPVTTTVADEKSFNLFMRLESQEVKDQLSGLKQFKGEERKEIFLTLRELRNTW